MAVPNQDPESKHTGNGVTTSFPYVFLLLSAGDLSVFVNGALQVLTTNYSVTGLGAPGGGSVVFSVAPPDGAVVLLQRNVVLERSTDYQYAGDFQASTVNRDYDRLWMAVQDGARDATTAIRFPRGERYLGAVLPSAAQRALKAIVFDASGNVSVSADDYVNQVAQVSAMLALAEAAAASADASAVRAENAVISYPYIQMTGTRIVDNPNDGSMTMRAVGNNTRTFIYVEPSGTPSNNAEAGIKVFADQFSLQNGTTVPFNYRDFGIFHYKPAALQDGTSSPNGAFMLNQKNRGSFADWPCDIIISYDDGAQRASIAGRVVYIPINSTAWTTGWIFGYGSVWKGLTNCVAQFERDILFLNGFGMRAMNAAGTSQGHYARFTNADLWAVTVNGTLAYTVNSNGTMSVTGGVTSKYQAVTVANQAYAGSFTPDIGAMGAHIVVPLTGDITINNATCPAGAEFTLHFPATGSNRTITLAANYHVDAATSLVVTAGTSTLLTFRCTQTGSFWLIASRTGVI